MESRYGDRVRPKRSRLVRDCTPDEVLAGLRLGLGGQSGSGKDPRVESMVGDLRESLLRFLRGKFPKLIDLVEDAAQRAILNLLTSTTLKDIRDFDAYAERVAVNELLALLRDQGRELEHRAELASQRADLETHLGTALPYRGRSTEDLAAMRELLEKALAPIQRSPVACWKLVEDLPEKEIERRTGLNHDQVQGIVRRVLEKLRREDGDPPKGEGRADTIRTPRTSSGRGGSHDP